MRFLVRLVTDVGVEVPPVDIAESGISGRSGSSSSGSAEASREELGVDRGGVDVVYDDASGS